MKELLPEINVGMRIDDETIPVGVLGKHGDNIYLQYERSFVESGLEISPFYCSLTNDPRDFDLQYGDGLPGVFHDSLPDGWGTLLLNNWLELQDIPLESVSILDRLAFVGTQGMGALVYEPDKSLPSEDRELDLDVIARGSEEIAKEYEIEGDAKEVVQELVRLQGSSGGARPKIVVGISEDFKKIVSRKGKLDKGFQHWLVKFPNTGDGEDSGAIEYVYALMAKEAGIEMPNVHLFPSKKGKGYFAIQRFDREHNRRIHMHSASGLLHSNFRHAALDYEALQNLTMQLTRHIGEVEKMFRLAVFNVLAHNRDDHGKNFSFLMDKDGEWKLAPGYDLTYSKGLGKEGYQSTSVAGESLSPGTEDLIKLGEKASLKRSTIDPIIEQAKDALSKWPQLAKEYDVDKEKGKEISSKIAAQIN